jgi:hypothetical protein
MEWFPLTGSELLLRTQLGHLDALQRILQEVSESEIVRDTTNNALALTTACKQDRQDIVSLLASYKIPILHAHLSISLKASNWSLARLLLNLGADVKMLSPSEIVPCDDLNVLDLMLGLGADPVPVWFEAISQEKAFPIRVILERYSRHTLLHSSETGHPLSWANECGTVGVRLAIENCQMDTKSITDHPCDLLKSMIAYAGSVYDKDSLALTLIPLPSRQLNLKKVKLCLESRVNPLETTAVRETLLHFIVREIVAVYDDEKKLPEYVICHDEKIVERCLHLGFDAGSRNADGRTVLD